jgi:dUTPase
MLGLFLRTIEISAEAGCIPEYDSLHDSASYLKAAEEVLIPAGTKMSIRTGVRMVMPDEELTGSISPNMLMALDGLIMVDSGRLIDRWDTSEIRTLIWNTSDEDVLIPKGRRVCRLSVQPNSHASYITLAPADMDAKSTPDGGAQIQWLEVQEVEADETTIQWSDTAEIEESGEFQI